MVAPLVKKLATSGIKKAASKSKTNSDKLLEIRKNRLKEDRASTMESLPSKQELKLESQLREKGEIPGTKTTIKRGMSLEESPLTKGEKTKIQSLSKKVAKTDSYEAEEAEGELLDYGEKLIEKYGSGVEDILGKEMEKSFNVKTVNKKAGGQLAPKKKIKTTKKPRGVGAAQRGYGKALARKKT